ncbi:uncharacterized protein LOC132296564 [Cornus florida]|uniref:uncharacterized protein LOC132296564 n=1 Tax=Cornus florida TaxID=4283 RepID=UPI00289883B4|nr:uncharacterized protein LOC132296564 [Cornus florida]
MFYACHTASEQKDVVWFLDSGCSNHMTGDKNIFLEIDSSSNSQVRIGNGALFQAKGKGTIAIETNKGRKHIRDVLLVPNLEQNLLNVGQLVEHRYSIHFDEDSCKIYDKGGVKTRPDIMYATSLLSRFMHNPSQIHVAAAKRVLRYIQGTLDFGILYEKNVDAKLFGFCYSDWTECVDDMRSTSGYAFFLGSGVFSWASKKQETLAQSFAKAEYVSASLAAS